MPVIGAVLGIEPLLLRPAAAVARGREGPGRFLAVSVILLGRTYQGEQAQFGQLRRAGGPDDSCCEIAPVQGRQSGEAEKPPSARKPRWTLTSTPHPRSADAQPTLSCQLPRATPGAGSRTPRRSLSARLRRSWAFRRNRRFHAVAGKRLGHLFPQLPRRAGYFKRSGRLADTIERLIAHFVQESRAPLTGWCSPTRPRSSARAAATRLVARRSRTSPTEPARLLRAGRDAAGVRAGRFPARRARGRAARNCPRSSAAERAPWSDCASGC